MSLDFTNSDLSDFNRAEWSRELQSLLAGYGTWTDLGDGHTVVSIGDGDRLIVTFETVEDIRATRDNALPLGVLLAQNLNDVAVISVITDGPTWFRHPALYSYFDVLVDEGIFEDYESVLFYGERMCGYAAAAYSVAAPGCNVLIVQPQATLDPRVAEWDHRFTKMRKISFTDRYGFAPDMVEAANSVFVVYDPEEELDAMHAALFTRPNVEKFRCRFLGRDIGTSMDEMHILEPALHAASMGDLNTATFAELYRARRNYAPYLRTLLTQTEDSDRSLLSAMLCRNVAPRKNMPRFRRTLDRLIERGVVDA